LNDSIKEVNKSLPTLNRKLDIEAVVMYGVVCIKCLGGLVEKLSHFNYTSEIIEIIVHQVTNKTLQLAQLAAEYIQKLFKEDKTLKISLEVIIN
jgi:hypothetical protein